MRTVFQARKFDGEKYLPRAESKLSSLDFEDKSNMEQLLKCDKTLKNQSTHPFVTKTKRTYLRDVVCEQPLLRDAFCFFPFL